MDQWRPEPYLSRTPLWRFKLKRGKKKKKEKKEAKEECFSSAVNIHHQVLSPAASLKRTCKHISAQTFGESGTEETTGDNKQNGMMINI